MPCASSRGQLISRTASSSPNMIKRTSNPFSLAATHEIIPKANENVPSQEWQSGEK